MSERRTLGKLLLLIAAIFFLMKISEGSGPKSYATSPTIPEYSGIPEARKSFERALDANRQAATPNWVGDAPKYYQCRGAECGGTQ